VGGNSKGVRLCCPLCPPPGEFCKAKRRKMAAAVGCHYGAKRSYFKKNGFAALGQHTAQAARHAPTSAGEPPLKFKKLRLCRALLGFKGGRE